MTFKKKTWRDILKGIRHLLRLFCKGNERVYVKYVIALNKRILKVGVI